MRENTLVQEKKIASICGWTDRIRKITILQSQKKNLIHVRTQTEGKPLREMLTRNGDRHMTTGVTHRLFSV
jgi:hypothetical protein